MRIISEKTYAELTKKHQDTKLFWSRRLKSQERDFDSLADAFSDYRTKTDKQTASFKRQLDRTTAERDALKADAKNYLELEKRSLVLEQREAMLKVKEESFKLLETENANVKKLVEKSRDEGYKSGYGDGVADGLRKGAEISADDRKMMSQIAALAAASHSTDASKEIGAAVAGTIKDLNRALPAGKK